MYMGHLGVTGTESQRDLQQLALCNSYTIHSSLVYLHHLYILCYSQ